MMKRTSSVFTCYAKANRGRRTSLPYAKFSSTDDIVVGSKSCKPTRSITRDIESSTKITVEFGRKDAQDILHRLLEKFLNFLEEFFPRIPFVALFNNVIKSKVFNPV